MLYSQENVRQNLRHRNGKRVFFLGKEDTLTPAARDWLRGEDVAILPAEEAPITRYRLENGAVFTEKPEHYTHLREDILVPKTHPVIAFRGAMDTLQAQLLLAQAAVAEPMREAVGEILRLAGLVIRWEVLQEPAHCPELLGLTPQQLRSHSHNPKKYYGIPHFQPAHTDGNALLQLNLARCLTRAAELQAAHAFGSDRQDLQQVLNRMSSALYILMLRLKQAHPASTTHTRGIL